MEYLLRHEINTGELMKDIHKFQDNPSSKWIQCVYSKCLQVILAVYSFAYHSFIPWEFIKYLPCTVHDKERWIRWSYCSQPSGILHLLFLYLCLHSCICPSSVCASIRLCVQQSKISIGSLAVLKDSQRFKLSVLHLFGILFFFFFSFLMAAPMACVSSWTRNWIWAAAATYAAAQCWIP